MHLSFFHSEYGGDAHWIFLAGHRLGAHLALLTVLESLFAQY
jgi:acetyl esterase/lipase